LQGHGPHAAYREGVRARDLPSWHDAWSGALYGPDGFFRRERPRDHFRTSVHVSTLFAEALLLLARRQGLTSVTDVGAGDGTLLGQLDTLAPGELALQGIELAPRPAALPAHIGWRSDLPGELTGLVVANEWLDNIPCDVVQVDHEGVPRYVHVDPETGDEALGGPCHVPWLARWWPLTQPGNRAEVGSARDRAWGDVVRRLRHGLAVAVDYGHTRETRPPYGTLASYRDGRQVELVPDGTRDVTAHVAVDSLDGERTTQRRALHALGVAGTRPDVDEAHADPVGYVDALGRAGEAAELTATGGLGDFWWVSVGRGVAAELG
jgi:SAM-dependent MidA family methyltransferase